ncbi:response regulator [Tundrisphaera lichenicola]|uniref:ATP-binding protein n=1 Tax=Tundrisphaera lichenicola TaxID=2029860 RepID=UPI003EBDEBCB
MPTFEALYLESAADARPRDTHNPKPPPILVVDDSGFSQRFTGRLIKTGTGREVLCASHGAQALEMIAESEPAAVVTDLCMPVMDGLELVQAIRSNHPRVPVILMTAFGSEEVAMRALKAGAANYLPKRFLANELVVTLERILAVAAGDRDRRNVLSHQTECLRKFEVGNDLNLIVPLIGLIQEDFDSFAIGDDTARVRIAVALLEALSNAVYHGNLECSSDLRQDDEQNFYDLADQRRLAEPYRSRRVLVESKTDRNETRVVIRDDGPGFDTTCLERPFDPDVFMRVGGRGMILIRTFLDEVTHNAEGNEITLVKRKSA